MGDVTYEDNESGSCELVSSRAIIQHRYAALVSSRAIIQHRYAALVSSRAIIQHRYATRTLPSINPDLNPTSTPLSLTTLGPRFYS